MHVLVGQRWRNRREVRARVGHQQVLGPRAVDRVAEPPAAERAAALRVGAVQAVEALAARRNRADDDPLADLVLSFEPGAELLDDADRLVAEDESRPDRILAADDVDVRSADGRRGDANHRLARSAASGLGTSSTAI